jgi:hypothetical protein
MRAALLVLLCNAACLSTMGVADGLRSSDHDVRALRGVPIDVEASEMTMLGDGSNPRTEVYAGEPRAEMAVQMRSQMAKALSDLWQADSGEHEKARIKVAYGYDFTMKPMAACLAILSLFGCPIMKDAAEVDLTIEYRGKTWTGHGSATKWEFMYRMGLFSMLEGEALGDALDDALSRPPR